MMNFVPYEIQYQLLISLGYEFPYWIPYRARAR